jgi:hemolysin D
MVLHSAKSPDGRPTPQGQKPAKPSNVISLRLFRPSPRQNADERAFLPAAMELVETPASPTIRLTALMICALIVTCVLWSILARIDTVAVAPGKVVPLGQVKVVQPLETSAIRAIYVDDGDHVAAGQLLVDLDPTDLHADLQSMSYDHGQAMLDAEVARVLLSRNPDTPFSAIAGVDLALIDANHAQAVSEITKHLAQISETQSDIDQRGATLEANAAQIERARATLPLLEEKRANVGTLWDKRVGTRQPVLDAEQQLIEKRAELASAEASTRQTHAEIRSLESKKQQTVAGFLADAADRRSKALQKLANLDQQIAKTRQRETYRRLVASVDGTVQNVKIHTPGAVVTTADTLMTIVPDGTGIEVEAMVENKDIGFVREGQEVELKFDAFPFTRYGLIKGTVRKLGRDAVQAAGRSSPQNGGTASGPASAPPSASDLSYPAKVTLVRDWIDVDGRRETIQPGMQVSAEIKTGDRRAIDFLLSPVLQTIREAGRER